MNFETMRLQMLSQQVRTWDVLDERVLNVLRTTPRETFVPEPDRELAFADMEIPLPHGQCMMTPKVEARVLQELAIEPDDAALEIGTGSGYLTACLAQLASRVISLEFYADMSQAAESRLRAAGIGNAELLAEDFMAAKLNQRFDVIAITASLPTFTDTLIKLLNPGGRLFVVVGRPPIMEARLVRLHADGSTTDLSLFETILTPMINAEQAEPFVL